ncbi:polysaccharide deacetylase [Paucimonas lemoignei]|uniref:Polysaccharide deacetylase n=1 Tax=Paucimonas lemoignei TaxID=29443 RepID=A0A4R3HTD4_PAULE|nr:polysaccharide deacetylase family protein [Paucimonas lemoignei]TCS34316.1 polysaccharide deacetylase [Paucimonas lemoignei]
MSKLVISLDFELFWGVGAAHSISRYGRNVKGEWQAIPKMLALFRRYGVRVSWATVGMLMCRDYAQWRAIRPSVMPAFRRAELSSYSMDALCRQYPDLFFGRPLVEQILETPGQELATHTYSHYYCGEEGATPDQFAADLECARMIGDEMGVRFRSIVLPRNQIVDSYLKELPRAGIEVYRGNPEHWLYKNGDAVVGGLAGRVMRVADSCLPLSGKRVERMGGSGSLVNVPASLFLYPWSEKQKALAPLRLYRMKQCMTEAAITDGICHLWWHPHNFGINTEQNLALLEALLKHYRKLADKYGMQSSCMGDFAAFAQPAFDSDNKLPVGVTPLAGGKTYRGVLP